MLCLFEKILDLADNTVFDCQVSWLLGYTMTLFIKIWRNNFNYFLRGTTSGNHLQHLDSAAKRTLHCIISYNTLININCQVT